MNSQLLSTWFDMGGYAGYVWPSYGVAAVILLAMLAISLKERRRARERLGEIERQS